MKRLLLVLPLLCSIASGQEYDKERYEKDLKDYNENHQSALDFLLKVQAEIDKSNSVFDSYIVAGSLTPEVPEQGKAFSMLADDGDAKFPVRKSYFDICAGFGHSASDIWQQRLSLASAKLKKDQSRILFAYKNIDDLKRALDEELYECLQSVALPPASEDYPAGLKTLIVGQDGSITEQEPKKDKDKP